VASSRLSLSSLPTSRTSLPPPSSHHYQPQHGWCIMSTAGYLGFLSTKLPESLLLARPAKYLPFSASPPYAPAPRLSAPTLPPPPTRSTVFCRDTGTEVAASREVSRQHSGQSAGSSHVLL
jgi:hypothetical protein